MAPSDEAMAIVTEVPPPSAQRKSSGKTRDGITATATATGYGRDE